MLVDFKEKVWEPFNSARGIYAGLTDLFDKGTKMFTGDKTLTADQVACSKPYTVRVPRVSAIFDINREGCVDMVSGVCRWVGDKITDAYEKFTGASTRIVDASGQPVKVTAGDGRPITSMSEERDEARKYAWL